MGIAIGLMSSILKGRFHYPQWTSKFTRKLAKSILGGEVGAFSEMVGHMPLLREFYELLGDVSPGVIGLETSESFYGNLRNMDTIAKAYLLRRLLGIQQALGNGELDNK